MSQFLFVGEAASAPVIHSYNTNGDKLAASGVNPCDYAVITGEGNRVEQYMPAGPVYFVSSLSDGALEGTYIGNPATIQDGSGTMLIQDSFGDGAAWIFVVASAPTYYSNDAVASPDLCTTWLSCNDNSAAFITVTRNDIASDANWIVLRNTVLLSVANNAGADLQINGVTCPDAAETEFWADPSNLTYDGAAGEIAISALEISGTYNVYVADGSNNGFILSGPGSFSFPITTSPRGQYTMILADSSF